MQKDRKNKYGNWEVIDTSLATKKNYYSYLCKCVCGKEKMVAKKYLFNGKSKSCGCGGVYPGATIGEYKVILIFKRKIKTNRYAKFRCHHGVVFTSMIANGGPRRKSCPCQVNYVSNFKHGESIHETRTREYNAWRQMRQRCNLKTSMSYKDYGARGIRVCKRWNDYGKFIKDMGRCPAGFSLDRINTNGNYTPKNCRWTDWITQANNRRNNKFFKFEGKSQTVDKWAREFGISRSTIWNRIRRGESFRMAVSR